MLPDLESSTLTPLRWTKTACMAVELAWLFRPSSGRRGLALEPKRSTLQGNRAVRALPAPRPRSLHCRRCFGPPASYSPPVCVPAAAWRQDFLEFMSGSATIDLTLDDEPWASPVAPLTSPGPRLLPTSRSKADTAGHAGANGHAGLCPADMCNANAKEQLPMQIYAGSMPCTLTWGWAHLSHMGSLNAS